MSAEVEWREDGTPFSPRFGDIYRTRSGGLAQARHVFLAGCGLPAVWRGQGQWRILETGLGLGLNFLAAWQAWHDDPQRPRTLHYVAIEAFPATADDLLRSAAPYPELAPLARELADQWWGMTPGVHRLVLAQGQVLLTVCIGDIQPMLRELDFTADSLFLDGFAPELNPAMWDLSVFKSLARLARRGTGVASWTSVGAVRRALAQCGFEVRRADGLPPKRHCIAGAFAPAWTPRTPPRASAEPGRCVVVGAGLAGAAVAASLARRGWQVQVLDGAEAPAQGASGLPAGLFAPHLSPDDALLSRLTRRGIRATLQAARALLEEGRDWACTGVLEHRPEGRLQLQERVRAELVPEWVNTQTASRSAAAGLDPQACVHWLPQAGWMRPGALVQAWLATPGVEFVSDARVARLVRASGGSPPGGADADADAAGTRVVADPASDAGAVTPGDAAAADASGDWILLDAQDQVLARAPLVVLAAAQGCAALLESAGLPAPVLQPVRGQVSFQADPHDVSAGQPAGAKLPLPPWPVNGNGHFIPDARLPDGRRGWLSGSTYDSGDADPQPRDGDHDANLARLRVLLPATGQALAPAFGEESGQRTVEAWASVRCASADRRPLVGPWEHGLWLCAALGSRGLSLAALCAEIIAARLHGEPLPLERRLAAALGKRR